MLDEVGVWGESVVVVIDGWVEELVLDRRLPGRMTSTGP